MENSKVVGHSSMIMTTLVTLYFCGQFFYPFSAVYVLQSASFLGLRATLQVWPYGGHV